MNHHTLSNSGQSLPARQLCFAFHPAAGVSPIQAASFHLQSVDGECLPATQLYLSVFTCLTVSLDLPSDAGEVLPARQPYLFHPTAGETYIYITFMHLADALSKATYSAFRLYICIVSMCVPWESNPQPLYC